MCEALKRIRELERRFPEEGSHQRRLVSGMLFANFLSQPTKKHILSLPPVKNTVRDKDGQDTVVDMLIREDIELMKKATEDLLTLEVKARPTKMDVSSLVTYNHEEWVTWME